ncbi:MAG: hypothetical protein RL240_2973, partial [Planctomycetota bacterium]
CQIRCAGGNLARFIGSALTEYLVKMSVGVRNVSEAQDVFVGGD